jgi:hypothetical protein
MLSKCQTEAKQLAVTFRSCIPIPDCDRTVCINVKPLLFSIQYMNCVQHRTVQHTVHKLCPAPHCSAYGTRIVSSITLFSIRYTNCVRHRTVQHTVHELCPSPLLALLSDLYLFSLIYAGGLFCNLLQCNLEGKEVIGIFPVLPVEYTVIVVLSC